MESLKSEISAMQTNKSTHETNDTTAEKQIAKMRAMSCFEYMKVMVSAALLGNGSAWYFYACSEYEDTLVDEACRFVCGDKFNDSSVE